QRLHVCGRDYETGGTTATPTSAAADSGGPLELLGTFSPPFGTARPIYGRHYTHPGDKCGIAVYIARSHDSYGVYQLLGGP
ncbi:MAG: hypothetical protein QOK14_936, partial [Frankiaceae bacterium]|nr:hypothetical protein [Frankiaceae bacterium]